MAMLNVMTKCGPIEGIPGWNQAVSLFRGIPYAQAPVGDLRWKAPLPVKPWTETLKAYNFGNISYQERRPSEGGGTLIGDEFYCVDWPRSEDCLYLNVWTPANTPEEKLPVAVYLHGGGYAQGYGYLNCYDGEGFCKRGCVFVTVNHRLGIFGYLAHPELTAEDTEHHSSGNYGTLDLIEALKWIHENISAFGGDPDKVTVFGQSGGGDKVTTMITSPLAKGLVHGGIMQSGGGLDRVGKLRYLPEQEAAGKELLEKAGITSIEDARKLSSEEVMDIVRNAADGNPHKAMGLFGPCADGYVFPEHMTDIILKGDFADIPTMIGCTEAEFGKGNRGTMQFFAGDLAFCMNQVKLGRKPSYQYYLTLVPPGADSAHHSAEHHYVFQTLGKSKRPYAGKDWDLSNQLAAYWANFVKYGNPNGEGLPEWTPYTAECPKAMEINYDLHMIDEPVNDDINEMVKKNLCE